MINKIVPLFGKRRGGFVPSGLLLDDYPDAAVAYSLRYLRTGYIGSPIIKVRRSSDNLLADFTPEEITNGTLVSWVGAGNNGFVHTWFDQSLFIRNAVQTTFTSQPIIIESGVLLTSNLKPTIKFNGKALIHNLSLTGISSLHSLFAVGQVIAPVSYAAWFLIGNNADAVNGISLLSQASITPSNWGTYAVRPRPSNSNINDSLQHLCTMIRDTSITDNGNFFLDEVSDGTYIATSGGVSKSIGQLNQCNDFISEIVLYPSNQTSNRVGIETNIKNYY